MIADASLSNAFDDLADLFLGGPAAPPQSASSLVPPPGATEQGAAAPLPLVQNGSLLLHAPSPATTDARVPAKPVAVEGLILGHLPMMAALWASQYPRMAAAADNGIIALVRLDPGMARVELFHPPRHNSTGVGCASRIGPNANGKSNHEHALPDRASSDLAGALSRAAQIASRIVVYSSLSADELLLARSPVVRSMALLTGADDASAVGAYKALKRLAAHDHLDDGDARERTSPQASSLLFRIAVMGSEEARATAAFHRLADAAKSFLSLPIEFAGHCRQIAGGVPGAILFEGPSAMTTQAVLESLAHGAHAEPTPEPSRSASGSGSGQAPSFTRPAQPIEHELKASQHASVPEYERPAKPNSLLAPHARQQPDIEETVIPIPLSPLPLHPIGLESASPLPPLPPGLTPLPVRCPFDRDPILAIDRDGVPQVVTAAAAGHSPAAAQRLLSVGAWLWSSRELLAMVCPTLRSDARPVLHLITDRPTDVSRLIDSDLRLHIRIPPAAATGTLPLN